MHELRKLGKAPVCEVRPAFRRGLGRSAWRRGRPSRLLAPHGGVRTVEAVPHDEPGPNDLADLEAAMAASRWRRSPSGDALCPVAALEAILVATPSPRPLAGASSYVKIATAAGCAAEAFSFDPFPARGLDQTDLAGAGAPIGGPERAAGVPTLAKMLLHRSPLPPPP